ncbi:MAG TPA: hypothetical protein VD766_01435, partial [Solirubrobacterales bacterium]|nr:hypothetical protein [Solirubrobacterales bacterium]
MANNRRRRRRLGRSEPPRPAQQSQAKHEESKLGLVRELCSFDRRLSGTDAERRAANAMATRLRRQG